jgi:acyl-CoA thioester hydrolase
MRIKYIRPLHFKQTIRVHASLTEYENRLKIDFVICDAHSSEKLSKAYTVQVAVDMATQEMCFVSPPILLEKIQQYHQKQSIENHKNP